MTITWFPGACMLMCMCMWMCLSVRVRVCLCVPERACMCLSVRVGMYQWYVVVITDSFSVSVFSLITQISQTELMFGNHLSLSFPNSLGKMNIGREHYHQQHHWDGLLMSKKQDVLAERKDREQFDGCLVPVIFEGGVKWEEGGCSGLRKVEGGVHPAQTALHPLNCLLLLN